MGNTRAMQSALTLADELTPDSVREMHRVLMDGTNHTPGDWRTQPVWIGRSARSPVGATFVAPQHERVPGLMDDVMAFARRDDLPVLAQVAIVHAQFETIHPFTDGNGRTGRALVQSMLRGKDITRSVTVPVRRAPHRRERLPRSAHGLSWRRRRTHHRTDVRRLG
ncbi:hypothetical protein GCM10009747_30560 [Agromyces humatus]|uniref:Fido domain-containing protein n=1 Tax=Agromyces humatus TaxID=279573 RepID=A0ABP4X553_9MICO